MTVLDVDPTQLDDPTAWDHAVTEGFWIEQRIDGWAWGVAGAVFGDGFRTIGDAKAGGLDAWRERHAGDVCGTCRTQRGLPKCPECAP